MQRKAKVSIWIWVDAYRTIGQWDEAEQRSDAEYDKEKTNWKMKHTQGARDEQRVLKDVAARQEKELERWDLFVCKKKRIW